MYKKFTNFKPLIKFPIKSYNEVLYYRVIILKNDKITCKSILYLSYIYLFSKFNLKLTLEKQKKMSICLRVVCKLP